MPGRAHAYVDGAGDRPFLTGLLPALNAMSRSTAARARAPHQHEPAFSGLLDLAGANDDACRAVFYCTDGHRESISIADLLHCDAFLACDTSEESSGDEDCAVRLVVPGKFGHRWAKSVKRIEIVADN
jgi:hypothetical protein